MKRGFIVVCGIALLTAGLGCKTYYASTGTNARLLTLDSLMTEDSSAVALIEPYKTAIEIEMNEIISYSEVAITKNQPEGLLNNFISDLILYMCNTYYSDGGVIYDVVILNNGGLRAALPKGLITVGDVYRLMPFENETVVLTLTPEHFLDMVNYIIHSGGVPFAGMRITSRQMELSELSINGVPFDNNRNYRVITSDYLAAGGDKMEFFNDPLEYIELSVLIRDLIIDYLKEQNAKGVSLHPEIDRRIVYE